MPTIPNFSTPCGRATAETDFQLFQEWAAHKAGGLRLYTTPLDTPRRTPMHMNIDGEEKIQSLTDDKGNGKGWDGEESDEMAWKGWHGMAWEGLALCEK
jgi:hypothetical protein